MKTGDIDCRGELFYGGWQLVEEKVFTEAATSYTFSGLNGDVDEEYRVISRLVNGYDGSCVYRIHPNNDSGSNYGYQWVQGDNTTASALRGSTSGLSLNGLATLNYIGFSDTIIYAKSGSTRTAIQKRTANITGTTVTSISLWGESWNNTTDNITSLVMQASQANGIGIGSHFYLFKRTLSGLEASTGLKIGNLDVRGKLKAGVFQLVEKYEVTGSAETSHTFSGLNGDTDELYLIKTRIVNGYNGGCIYNILLNNDSTANIYGRQALYGGDTTLSAVRGTLTSLDPSISNDDINKVLYSEILLYAKSGYVRTAITQLSRSISTTTVTYLFLNGLSWNNTVDEITNIVVSASQTGGLGVGTVIETYKLSKHS
jgi:hypothetical protein